MWKLLSRFKGFSADNGSSLVDPGGFLSLCVHNVRSIEDCVKVENLLSKRQCQDLSAKLSKTVQNVQELVLHFGAPIDCFRSALQSLYRYLEKARLLVENCSSKDWCAASVFQIHNENAFREILLEVGLCYNAIHEQAQSTSVHWNVQLEDLRQSSVFQPAPYKDVHDDRQEIRKRLVDLLNEPERVKLLDYPLPSEAQAQCLARYLLMKLDYKSEPSQADTADMYHAILCSKEIEPLHTWGTDRFLGAGGHASGVVSTQWLGVPCAKKVFHGTDENLFLKEASILAQLNHPRIARLICCGNDQGPKDHFIAMELMERSLLHLIEDQKKVPFALHVTLDIIQQISYGLYYLHDEGIAHRDLKPQNVVVTKFKSPHLGNCFDVKLIGFGMSKTKILASMSDTISVRGPNTTWYRAPEVYPGKQEKGKAMWFKVDVFSFAMICAHLLTLKNPFKDVRPARMYEELMDGRRPSLPLDCPKELVALLTDCWATNPQLRPSFSEVSIRLEVLSHKLLRGLPTLDEDIMSYDYIKSELEELSCIQRSCVATIDDKVEDILDKMDKTRDSLDKTDKTKDSLNEMDEMEDLSAKTHFYLDLSYQDVQIIANLVDDGNFLNKRQCQDLSTKLLKTIPNVKELVFQSGLSATFFCPAIEVLYQHVQKAKQLVEDCYNKDSCAAFTFQIQNENTFREILLEVSLCYNVIFEQAKDKSQPGNFLPQDLRQSNTFLPTSSLDVHKDQQEIKMMLEDLANLHHSFELSNPYNILRESLDLKQCHARYLLLMLNFMSQESQNKIVDASSAIFWVKDTEPSGTWGSDAFNGRGAGASGVYSTKLLGIPCAKKIFHGQGFEGWFFKEASMLIHLNHPRIVKFICCGNGQGPGDRFIAMELMEKSLSQLIEAQKGVPFSLPIVLNIIGQIARAMCYLHDVGVSHRDLKPDNVVVTSFTFPHLSESFSVKLIDFGVSKAEIEISSKAITMTGVGIGTTRYRAPELHPKGHPERKGKAIWFKADVYSFALTCAHLLSLKSPFIDMEGWELSKKPAYDALIHGALRPELPEDCPEELATLLKKCWGTIPSLRPSFLQICTMLESFRFKLLSGLSTLDGKIEFKSHKYIKSKLEEFSSIHRLEKAEKIHDALPEAKMIDVSPIHACAFSHALQLLPQSIHDSTSQFICSICWNQGDGELYHCQTCQLDIHTSCAENKDMVKVFFHEDTLHLLIQDYYIGDPNAICSFCEESIQNCEWMYRCEQCSYDVHALCTKYSREIKHPSHPHPLTLVQSPVGKSRLYNRMFCNGCKGDLQGYRYTCTRKSCAFYLHPFCAILPTHPRCFIDSSHRLSLDTQSRDFLCYKCNTCGDSWLYHCDECDVDIHVECIDDMEEEEKDDWSKAYDEFIVESCNKDGKAKVIMFLELLDKLLENQAKVQVLELKTQAASSSSSRPPPDSTMRAMAKLQTLTLNEKQRLSPIGNIGTQEKNAANLTAERKAKKMAAKDASQKRKARLKEEQDARLDNMEKLLQDLQSSKSDAKSLATKFQKLRKVHNTSHAFGTTQAQMKTRQAPRIVLFSERRDIMMQTLLTRFQVGIKEVQLHLLCEEPDHEHIVLSNCHEINQDSEELLRQLQPLLATGLQVVTKAIKCSSQCVGVESILPNMGNHVWDIQAMDLQEYALDNQLRAGRPETVIRYNTLFPNKSRLPDLRDIQFSENIEKEGSCDSGSSSFPIAMHYEAMKATREDYGLQSRVDEQVLQEQGKVETQERVQAEESTAVQWLANYLEENEISIFKTFGLLRVRYKETERHIFPRYRQGSLAWLCSDHHKRGLQAGTLESYPVRVYHNPEYDQQHPILN